MQIRREAAPGTSVTVALTNLVTSAASDYHHIIRSHPPTTVAARCIRCAWVIIDARSLAAHSCRHYFVSIAITRPFIRMYSFTVVPDVTVKLKLWLALWLALSATPRLNV